MARIVLLVVMFCCIKAVMSQISYTPDNCTEAESGTFRQHCFDNCLNGTTSCGDGCFEGPLQICEDRVYKIVCDEVLTAFEARITCTSIGYPYSMDSVAQSFNSLVRPFSTKHSFHCNGNESNITQCARISTTPSPLSGNGFCSKFISLKCSGDSRPTVTTRTSASTAGSTDITTTSSASDTSSISSPPTLSTTSSSTADPSPPPPITTVPLPTAKPQSIFSTPIIYLVVGLGAVVLSILLLIMGIICCCYRRSHSKDISPYDTEKQKSLTRDDSALHLDPAEERVVGAKTNLMDHHQLHQSSPLYEAIQSNENSSTHSNDSPNSRKMGTAPMVMNAPPLPPHPQAQSTPTPGLYSVINPDQTYAQIEMHIDSGAPAAVDSQNSDYQQLNHRTSSLSRTKPPRSVQAVNKTALAFNHGLIDEGDLVSHEVKTNHKSLSLPRSTGSSRHENSSPKKPHLEEIRMHQQEPDASYNGDANFYHIIEPPPNYASLEKFDEASELSTGAVCNGSSARNGKGSVHHSSSPPGHNSPDLPARFRSNSKGTSSSPPRLACNQHTTSHSSLSSTASSNSQTSRLQSDSPLITRANGSRIGNKYTQSPVQDKKVFGSSPKGARLDRPSGLAGEANTTLV